jgi:hypothetical protein
MQRARLGSFEDGGHLKLFSGLGMGTSHMESAEEHYVRLRALLCTVSVCLGECESE